MNKRLITYIYTVILCFIAVFIVSAYAYSASSEDFKLLKIDGTNQKAVIKTVVRGLKIIHVGDEVMIESSKMKVLEIAQGRVVLEEQTDMGKETVIIRLENGKQRTERLSPIPDKKPILYQPKTVKSKEPEGQRRSGHGSRAE